MQVLSCRRNRPTLASKARGKASCERITASSAGMKGEQQQVAEQIYDSIFVSYLEGMRKRRNKHFYKR